MPITNKWKLTWAGIGCATLVVIGYLVGAGSLLLSIIFASVISVFDICIIECGFGDEWRYVEIHQSADRTPQWSADGRILVVNLGGKIYGATINGNGLWRIAHTDHTPGGVLAPSLSVNGEVAYLKYRYYDELHIELTDTDGTEPNRLFSDTGTNGYPTWSTDGSRLAFATNGQQITIMTKRELGLSSRLLSILTFWRKDDAQRKYDTLSIPGKGNRIFWSNDSRRIAFIEQSPSRIVNTQWDGADEKIVKEQKSNIGEFEPTSLAWSTADNRIYFVYYEFVDRENSGFTPSVRSVRPDGSDERIIALWWDDFRVEGLKLSPDGSQLLFTAYRSSDDEDEGLFVMKTDGSGVIKIFNPSSLDSSRAGSRTVYASWSPDGSRIAVHNLRYSAGRGSVFTTASDGTDARSLIRPNRDGKQWPGRDEPLPYTPIPLTP